MRPSPAFPSAIPFTRVLAFAALSAGAVSALAQAAPGEGPPSTSWSLGVGVISMQQPYAGMKRETQGLPVLQFENEYVHIFGPQIGLTLPGLAISDSQKLNFSLVARYDGSGYKPGDAPILSGMAERKGGIWAGAEVEWKNDLADLKAAWLGDASGNSKGQKFSLGLERTWHFGGKFMLTPRVEASWHDKNFVDYYYGVRASEARAGRAAYAGKAGMNTELGLRGIYLFDQRHSMFVDVATTRLDKHIQNSPLVDRSSENRVMLGYTYRFR